MRARSRTITGALGKAAVAAVVAMALLSPALAQAFDPALEAKNFAKTTERLRYVTLTPEFQSRLIQADTENLANVAKIATSDPERVFVGNVCANGAQECAGDVRFYDWEEAGMGMVEPVLFTARNGSTLSGRLWASAEGPKKRPLVVITNGSVQAPEQLYWGQAATLAKHGFIVLTYDPQGQGLSDTFGAGPDLMDGVPSQEGRPFYDNTEDALDFALSTPASPYDPRPSCTSGTDHSDKQDRRVEAGLNAEFNPLHSMIDRSRVGIAGHSLGAAAVSYVGQIDPRVDAVVAWDNLGPRGEDFGPPECASGSSPRPANPAITKPAMGITNDYGLTPTPFTSDPDPQTGNDGFLATRDAGVDTFEAHIRGGTHYESSFIPGDTTVVLGLGSLRGGDLVAWYTSAWMERWVGCDGAGSCERQADARLLTDRWRNDKRSGEVDANDDPNAYSFYSRSRYDFHESGGEHVVCDDMRAGCDSMGPDGLPAGYDFVSDAYTLPSGRAGDGEPCALPQRGTAGRDTPETLPPSGGGDSIRGRGGNDRLRGGVGDDCLYGAAGNDRLNGGAGKDKIQGGAGNDRLVGGPGKDKLKGGKGSDRIRGSRGRDKIDGGPGPDRIDARGGGRDTIRCGKGRDRVRADRRDRLGKGC